MNSTINIKQVPVALTEYFKKYMLPHVAENMRFWYLLGAKAVIPKKIAEFAPKLAEFGAMDESGNIDIDMVHKLLEETFNDVQKAQIGNFDLNVADLPQFINFIKNGNQ